MCAYLKVEIKCNNDRIVILKEIHLTAPEVELNIWAYQL
jgi:hypothetical protein